MILCRALLGFLFCIVSLPLVASSTTIRGVSVEEMVEHAALVFEGTVASIEVRGSEDPSSIHTCAQFDIIEVLKGPSVGERIELCFAGGTRGRFRRQIEGMIYPTRGETGIYFVKSLTERYVSPFYGWQQGHFRVVQAGSRVTREVQVSDGRPVVGIERTEAEPAGLSTGVARGVRVLVPWGTRQRPMTLEGFKAKLRAILEGLR